MYCRSRQAAVRFACYVTEVTHSQYVILNIFPRQQRLRERNALLRCTYSASSVPRYVRLLCTCTVCSVYRVPSVIMCSSTLILPFFAVTAVRFEMRYHFSTHALRGQYQYTCTTRFNKHVHVRTYFVVTLYVILAKSLLLHTE